MKKQLGAPTFNVPPQRTRVGYCYMNALRFLAVNPQWILVHGVCIGTGEKNMGQEFGHAWNEKLTYLKVGNKRIPQWWVYDAKTKKTYLREIYYLVGKVQYTRRYSLQSARKMMCQHESYGPWCSKIYHTHHLGKRIPLNKGVKKCI